MKVIKVEIGREGIKVLYQGFEGEGCFQEASKLYALLKQQYGLEVSILQSQPTDEYYVTDKSREKGVVRGV
jgi:hypothetical protein